MLELILILKVIIIWVILAIVALHLHVIYI
jgi:hypothetical protein